MQNGNQKMSEAIEFFETMLESMPGDRTSLEFLAVAYEQTGQSEKRRKCLIELTDTLISENALDDADSIARQLLNNYSSDRDAMLAVKRVNEAVAAKEEGDSEKSDYTSEASSLEIEGDGSLSVPDPGIEVHAHSRAALSAEMDLVWMLKDKEILPLDICEELICALTEFPVSERPQLISALSFLDDKHPEWIDAVMCELQKMTEMPAVPLELFNTDDILPSGISASYMLIRGVVPFAAMDNEYLIAILNPLDKALHKDITSRLGTTCHFFLSHPRVSLDVLSNKFETKRSE